MDDRATYSTYSTCMLSFLAGGVAGATVALLMAPQSGSATRELMGRKLRDTADSARELKDEVVRRGGELREEAAHRVGEAASALAGNGRRKGRGNADDAPSA